MPPSLVNGGRWRLGAIALAFVACLATLGLYAPVAIAASPPVPAAESSFVNRINAIRVGRGLHPLRVDDQLTTVARQWAATMADGAGLRHNPDLTDQVTAAWTRLSENVGFGSDVERISDDFQTSPIHMKNIVDPQVNWIGVGVVRDSRGWYWTTHIFMAVQSTGGAPSPAPLTKPQPDTTERTAGPPPTTAAPAPPPTVPVEPAEPTIESPTTPAPSAQPRPGEVALSVNTAPTTERSTHPTALAMILFAIVTGSLLAATVIRLIQGRQGTI